MPAAAGLVHHGRPLPAQRDHRHAAVALQPPHRADLRGAAQPRAPDQAVEAGAGAILLGLAGWGRGRGGIHGRRGVGSSGAGSASSSIGG
jgi:hypothetical protein